MNSVAIDVGCGRRKRAGSIGVDIARLPTVDVIADATRGLPFADSTVDVIYASHLLEHIPDLPGFMAELWRVCRPGAKLYITVPHASSAYMTWRDPTHVRGVSLATLTYFDRRSESGADFAYYAGLDFRIVFQKLRFVAGGRIGREARGRRAISRLLTDMLEAAANASPYAQHLCERWWGHWFGIAEAYAILEAVKPAGGDAAAAHLDATAADSVR